MDDVYITDEELLESVTWESSDHLDRAHLAKITRYLATDWPHSVQELQSDTPRRMAGFGPTEALSALGGHRTGNGG